MTKFLKILDTVLLYTCLKQLLQISMLQFSGGRWPGKDLVQNIEMNFEIEMKQEILSRMDATVLSTKSKHEVFILRLETYNYCNIKVWTNRNSQKG